MFLTLTDLPPAGGASATVTSLAGHRAGRTVPTAVRQAIQIMNDRYFEPITLTDVAAQVYVSPFHFSRMFAKAVGVTPGRYLTAVRLFEAKRLLMTTSLTISDIVCSVGYSSVGTFTTRFTKAVGMSPSQFRDPSVRDLLLAVAPHFQRLPSLAAVRAAAPAGEAGPGAGRIRARVDLPPSPRQGTLFVGVFAEAVPQGRPLAFTAVPAARSTTVTLHGIPPGRWQLLAAADHLGADGAAGLSFGTPRTPVRLAADEEVAAHLRIRPLQPTDPPIAISLAPRDGLPTTPEPACTARPVLAVAA